MTPTQTLPMAESDRRLIGLALVAMVALATLPWLGSALVVDKLTYLFILVMFAVMWNLLAGYAGLVSVGQQAFIGLGGYALIRLVDAGLPPFPMIFVAALLAGLVAWAMSWFDEWGGPPGLGFAPPALHPFGARDGETETGHRGRYM